MINDSKNLSRSRLFFGNMPLYGFEKMHLAEDSHTFIWHKLLEHVSSYFILLKVYVDVFLYDQYYEKEKKY